MTITTAALHIGEVWPSDVIRAQEFELVIAPRVFRQWKFAGHGDVYHIPRRPNIETETKSASTALTMRTYTDTEQTVTINVHQGAGFEVEDITKVLSNTDIAAEMKQSIGYSLGRAVDVNIAAFAASFSQIVGTLGVELTYDNFTAAENLLADAGINLNENCTWFISPGARTGLYKQEIFINQLYQGTDMRAVNTGKLGQLLGAPIIKSNLLTSPAAGQAEAFVMDKRALALIMAQEIKMGTEYLAKELATAIVGSQLYGSAEVQRYAETPGNITATDTWAVLLRTIL